MDAEFWHRKWQIGEIGFHEGQPNVHLVKHFSKLKLPENSRLFLPLCGKTKDIAWLLAQGFRVVGAELSELAVKSLFEEMAIAPTLISHEKFTRYSAENLDVFVGDIFDLTQADLGKVDAVYDRAALVALPEATRIRYTRHMMNITSNAPQLLIAFEYDQSVIEGPPFSISEEEVERHYGNDYRLELAERADVEGGLKGKVAATEAVWLMFAESGCK